MSASISRFRDALHEARTLGALSRLADEAYHEDPESHDAHRLADDAEDLAERARGALVRLCLSDLDDLLDSVADAKRLAGELVDSGALNPSREHDHLVERLLALSGRE